MKCLAIGPGLSFNMKILGDQGSILETKDSKPKKCVRDFCNSFWYFEREREEKNYILDKG